MANRGLGFHQDATTFDAFFTDLVDTLVAPGNATGWSDHQASGVPHRRILKHTTGTFLDIHRKIVALPGASNNSYNQYWEFFLGFADAWDDVAKRPALSANVCPVGAVVASGLNNGDSVASPPQDVGSWTGQFYWWMDTNGFVVFLKPDTNLPGSGFNSGATQNTFLLLLERIPAASREQPGGTDFVAYVTYNFAGTAGGQFSGDYYGTTRRTSGVGTATQPFWNSPYSTSTAWYHRWPFAHPFGVTDHGLPLSGVDKHTGHRGRGSMFYCATWPYEAGAQTGESEASHAGARRAQGGNDKVYFMFPWFADDANMTRLMGETRYFFKGQLARGLLDGDQVAVVDGGVTRTYLYKLIGPFVHGVFIRYA